MRHPPLARLIRTAANCVGNDVSAPDPDDFLALALDAASGAASAGEALLVEASAAIRSDSAEAIRLAEALGGALLEQAGDLPPANSAQRAQRAAPNAEAHKRAYAAVALACADPEAMAWRTPIPGVQALRLPTPGARLIRLKGGSALPMHGHSGEERTLVLRGAFEDEHGGYEPGDMAFCTDAHTHSPRALSGPDCVCLIVSSGEMRFRGLLERAAYRLLWTRA